MPDHELKHVVPLPPEQWDARIAPIARDMNGNPLNVHRLMANNPALLEAWWSFRMHSVNGGALGNRIGELVILRVAAHLGVWYEWGSHVDRSLRCGLTIEEIRSVLDPEISENWPEAEAAILTAVDDLIRNKRISGPVRLRLEMHFSTEQIMDLIAIHGMYLILGCMIETWGLELDPDVEERVLPHMNSADFEEAAASWSHGQSF